MESFVEYRASAYEATIITANDDSVPTYTYIKTGNGDLKMWSVSAQHGRSFIVDKTHDGRYIISKGNGLSYTTHTFVNTGEMGSDTWGLLLKKDAIRDFTLGNEIASLGIKTNEMEYVIELDTLINLPNGESIRPILLQYSVECPYRISDAPFIDKSLMDIEVAKWRNLTACKHEKKYQVAAEVLLKNLRTLHDNKILHNAVHEQNFTWALELLDFELACSPTNPYDSEDYQRHVPDLFSREIIQTYQVILYIAGALREDVDYKYLDAMFRDYGFDISKFSVPF